LFFDYKPWAAVVLAVVLLSVACWLPFIRGLTRSIRQLTRATGQIAEGHFEVSLPLHRRDELGQLNQSIHQMAERLCGFVHGQKRFLGDIAHELCSPIARMQMALGILEQRTENEQAEYVADVQAELEQMSTLINELLAFSKAQINTSGTALTAVNVADTLRRVLERETSADAQIETDVGSEIEVMAHPDYLFRSLANLVRNAIRYAGPAGPIRVSAANGEDDVLISVADNGPGLPEAELENVFKPFYRPEYARQRETGGTGLGLAIVRSCVEACGGSVHCRNRLPKGLIVDISLPSVKAP
jgi:two-component system sensor histidine kinase CpxA